MKKYSPLIITAALLLCTFLVTAQECSGGDTSTCNNPGTGTSVQCSSCGKCIYTINFDDITEYTFHDGGDYSPITIYQGFTWINTYVLNAATGNCGYDVAAVSTPNVGFSGQNNPLSFSRVTPFRLYSMFVTPAFRDGVTLSFVGSLLGVPVGQYDVVLNNDQANLVIFPTTFNKIDMVTMTPSGGTAVCGGETGLQTAIDNIIYSSPSICGDYCTDADLGEQCDQGPTGGSNCLATCQYDPRVCLSTGKKCRSGQDKCCEYYPPSSNTPVQQCYAPTYHCVPDTANTARNCLCKLEDGCCNQVCFTSDYHCVQDKSSLATKPYCLCKANQECCNKQCYTPGTRTCNS